MSIEEDLELSALLRQSRTLASALLSKLQETEFRTAVACARNAVQALAACEEDLKSGGPDQ